MKKILFILTVAFSILTFAGAVFVLTSQEAVNAGYAVIPMGICLACLAGYRASTNKKK